MSRAHHVSKSVILSRDMMVSKTNDGLQSFFLMKKALTLRIQLHTTLWSPKVPVSTFILQEPNKCMEKNLN